MNDDTISRQAAIDALTHFTNLSWDKLKTIYPMLTVIEELPSAERRGRWNNGFCSVCGTEALTEWNDTGGEYAFTTFCPNCGAKMDSSAVKGE